MDGSRPVKELVVAYFYEYGSIAFGRVTRLVSQLKAAGFLTDPPVDVYAEVGRQCRRRTPAYWGSGCGGHSCEKSSPSAALTVS